MQLSPRNSHLYNWERPSHFRFWFWPMYRPLSVYAISLIILSILISVGITFQIDVMKFLELADFAAVRQWHVFRRIFDTYTPFQRLDRLVVPYRVIRLYTVSMPSERQLLHFRQQQLASSHLPLRSWGATQTLHTALRMRGTFPRATRAARRANLCMWRTSLMRRYHSILLVKLLISKLSAKYANLPFSRPEYYGPHSNVSKRRCLLSVAGRF